MFKTMWMQFWNKLGDKERKVVAGVGGAVLLVAVLVVVGQLTKPKPAPLLGQYENAMHQAAKDIKEATKKPQ